MRHEAGRYILVGLVSNILLYALYIGVTELGVGHITAMTALFIVGVVQTFYFNRRWTFANNSIFGVAFRKYLLIYCAAWLVNLFVLILFVDVLGFAHELVQGAAVMGIAVSLFVLQKFWVFPTGRV